MSLRFIVNSDDYGRSAGISRGIQEAHRNGIVTSTTCMMNFPTTTDDIRDALQEMPELGIGVHLVLTAGKPMLPAEQVPSLVDASGSFRRLAPFMDHLGEVVPAEAKAEWKTQIEAFIVASGRQPTHLDSHHHSSYFTEGLFQAMLELAQEYNCPIRRATAVAEHNMDASDEAHSYVPRLLAQFKPTMVDAFYTSFYDEGATKEALLDIINGLPDEGIYELMCHPGYVDDALIASTVYARQRAVELSILTDSDVKEAVKARGIELVSYAALKAA